MRKTILSITLLALVGVLAVPLSTDACTGITLRSKDGTTVVARTIEWAGSNLNSQYVVVPRGYTQQSYTPDGGMNGMRFTARHGYVGFAVEQKEFIAEGLNETGLSAGLFYFPNSGEYQKYDGSVSAILSCRPFFILIFLPYIKMNHYGFSRKSIWKNLETFP